MSVDLVGPGPRPALLDWHWIPAPGPCQRKTANPARLTSRLLVRAPRRPHTARSSTGPLTSRRKIPVLLGSTSLLPARGEHSSQARLLIWEIRVCNRRSASVALRRCDGAVSRLSRPWPQCLPRERLSVGTVPCLCSVERYGLRPTSATVFDRRQQ
jgi:hypothetical protein